MAYSSNDTRRSEAEEFDAMVDELVSELAGAPTVDSAAGYFPQATTAPSYDDGYDPAWPEGEPEVYTEEEEDAAPMAAATPFAPSPFAPSTPFAPVASTALPHPRAAVAVHAREAAQPDFVRPRTESPWARQTQPTMASSHPEATLPEPKPRRWLGTMQFTLIALGMIVASHLVMLPVYTGTDDAAVSSVPADGGVRNAGAGLSANPPHVDPTAAGMPSTAAASVRNAGSDAARAALGDPGTKLMLTDGRGTPLECVVLDPARGGVTGEIAVRTVDFSRSASRSNNEGQEGSSRASRGSSSSSAKRKRSARSSSSRERRAEEFDIEEKASPAKPAAKKKSWSAPGGDRFEDL